MKKIGIYLICNQLLEKFVQETIYYLYEMEDIKKKDVEIQLNIIQLNGFKIDFDAINQQKIFKNKIIKPNKNIKIHNLETESFADIMNYIVQQEQDYFCFLELGDLILPNWIKLFIQYLTKFDNDIILPLILLKQNNHYITVNDMPFIEGFYYEYGFFDYDIAIKKPSFILNGALFKQSSLNSLSSNNKELFKKELDFLTVNELFVRSLYYKKKARVLPFFGLQYILPQSYEQFNKLTTKINSSIFALPEEKGGISNEYYNFLIDKMNLSIIDTDEQ